MRQLWDLLDARSRWRSLILAVLTSVAGFVEILSVGLVIPFIAVASSSHPFGVASALTTSFVRLLERVHIPYTTAGLGGIFFLGVCLANFYLCVYQYYAARTVQLLKAELSQRVLRNISNRSLEWLDQENSADLIKITLNDVSSSCLLLNAVIQVAAVLSRCLVVYLFLLFTQFRLAMVMSVFLVLLYKLVRYAVQLPVARAGTRAQLADAEMIRSAHELIGGVRTVRATSTETYFQGRFERAAQRAVQPQVIRSIPGYVTRASLETVSLALVVAVLVYFNAKDGNLGNGLPILSSYAVAGLRLLPALQQTLVYLAEIRFLAPAVEQVSRVLVEVGGFSEEVATDAPCLKDRLCFEQVSYQYGQGRPAVQDIDLEIKKNQRVAIVGETGSGKSTLIDLLLGLRLPQSGGLFVDGQPIHRGNAASWRRHLGYVPQAIYLLDSSIAENVAFGVEPLELERVEKACLAANIHSFISTLPDGYRTMVGERGVRLSGGQCQRIGIARALYHDPDLLIFDEATSALDSQTEFAILESLECLKGFKTLVVIAHRLNTVWDFDRIVVLDQGRVVDSGTSQILMERCSVFQKLAQHHVKPGVSQTST